MSGSQTALIDARPLSYMEKVENEIVEALKHGVDGSVKVENFPANIRDYDLAALDGAILVHYIGSQYSKREGPANPTQTRRLNFGIVLLVRSLRGHTGAYHAIEDARLVLQGQSFQGAGPAEIVSDKLIEEKEGQWRFDITIGLNAPAVARDRATPTSLMQPITSQIAGRNGAI